MPTTNYGNRAGAAELTFSQRQSIQNLGLALCKLYKSYLTEPRLSGSSPRSPSSPNVTGGPYQQTTLKL